MRHSGTFLIVLLLAPCARAQHATLAESPLSDRRVSYTLHVSLESDTRSLFGTGQMTWRNPDAVAVDTLQLHLYLNAFKNSRSTFMRERGGAGPTFEANSGWGGIDITRLVDTRGADLVDSLVFIQPDDDNIYDETVAALALTKPVPPGGTIVLEVAFEAQLPRILARTGYLERHDGTLFFMAAQWFPKFGVYEIPGQRFVPPDAPRGRWNTHQFHANSEFYADFGSYDITVEVPDSYVVGATGVRQEVRISPGRRAERYIAEDVHDFAWTASPAFVEYTESWRHVTLRLLLQPEHRGQARRHFEAARVALEGYAAIVGPYPYTTLTLVDGLGQSNGMEYPTLILCGTRYGAPGWIRMTELVLIHEFGHQYFYGLLASNEFEEAWLDEGINSYVEGKVMDARYGKGSLVDFPGFRISGAAGHRLLYTRNAPERGALVTDSWKYASSSDYGRVSYSKSATVLRSLEGHIGWPLMQEVLRTYYDRWRFRHPTTRDFRAIAEEVVAEDLAWFFDQYVYGTAVVDYAVANLATEERSDGVYESRAQLERRRDGIFPQTVRITFEDGTSRDHSWDGQAASETISVVHSAPATRVIIDPDFRVPLDVDRLNNGMAVEADPVFAAKYTLRFTVWMQYALRVMESLF